MQSFDAIGKLKAEVQKLKDSHKPAEEEKKEEEPSKKKKKK